MKHTFLLEVELNDEAFAEYNAKRLKQGVQARTPQEFVEFRAHDGLADKVITSVVLAPAAPLVDIIDDEVTDFLAGHP